LTIDDAADDRTVNASDSSAEGGVLLLRRHSGMTTRLDSAARYRVDGHTRLLD
jgi:hypothetical protein